MAEQKKEKQEDSLTVHDVKTVSIGTRIRSAVEFIVFLLCIYSLVERYSGREHMVVNIVIYISVAYYIVDHIIKWRNRKKKAACEKNEAEAQK